MVVNTHTGNKSTIRKRELLLRDGSGPEVAQWKAAVVVDLDPLRLELRRDRGAELGGVGVEQPRVRV